MIENDLRTIATAANNVALMLQDAAIKVEKLRAEVQYWQNAYHVAKDQVERLSLDLGLKDDYHTRKQS